jgi:hypothetical protein
MATYNLDMFLSKYSTTPCLQNGYFGFSTDLANEIIYGKLVTDSDASMIKSITFIGKGKRKRAALRVVYDVTLGVGNNKDTVQERQGNSLATPYRYNPIKVWKEIIVNKINDLGSVIFKREETNTMDDRYFTSINPVLNKDYDSLFKSKKLDPTKYYMKPTEDKSVNITNRLYSFVSTISNIPKSKMNQFGFYTTKEASAIYFYCNKHTSSPYLPYLLKK